MAEDLGAVYGLQVLGAFRLTDPGGRPCRLPTRKAEALLAYLALAPDQAQRRDHLASLLWGDRGDKQARGSLNQTLYSLRKAVDPDGAGRITVCAETIALDGAAFTVDALRLAALAGAGSEDALAEALSLCRGSLLQGVNLRAVDFDEWLVGERIRCNELMIATAQRLLALQAAAGRTEAAIATAARALAIDGLQEPVHRILMQLYADQGRYDAALRQYETCRAVLKRELGAEPDAATEALARRLAAERARSGYGPAAVDADPTPAPDTPEATGSPEPAATTTCPAPPVTRPERKHVTLLHVEIGPPDGDCADPEAGLEHLDAALDAAVARIEAGGGYVVLRRGRMVEAVFGAPYASEDHAVQACFSALALRDAVGQATGHALAARIGLHSGDAVVRPAEGGNGYDVIGAAAGIADRLAQALTAGAIALTEQTRRHAAGFVEALDLAAGGVPPVPGVHAWLLIGGSPRRRPWQARAARGLTTFVGRDAEIAALHRALARAGQSQGEVMAIVGMPGVGKSRLVHELVHSDAVAGWRVLEAGASPLETGTPYGPIIHLLRGALGIDEAAGVEANAHAVRDAILAIDPALAPAVSAVCSILALPVDEADWATMAPPQRRQRILACLKALLFRLAQNRSLLLVIEDLHWIDGETQTVLDALVDGCAAHRLLLLVTHRPEYRHGWAGRSHFSAMRVDPLPADQAERLLANLLGASEARREQQATLRRLLIDWTQGTPLFLEEMVGHLLEAGALVREGDGCRLVAPLEQLDMPGSIQAVLAARIDRLAPEAKALLQAAAVIGAEVPEPLLAALSPLEGEVYAQALATLQGSEFLYESRQLPAVEFRFKHALTHDVAYGGMVREHRRALHNDLVAAIERRFAGRLEEQAERLGHHAAAGGQTEKAARYALVAAGKAIRHSAHQQAIAQLQAGLVLVAQLPETAERDRLELEFQKAMGVTMMAARGWGAQEVSDAYTRAQALCERIGDERELFTVLRGQGQFHMIRGELETARALGERCLALSARLDDAAVAIETHHLFWSNSFFMGDYGGAEHHAAHGIALYDDRTHHPLTYIYSGHDPGVCCRVFSGLIRWHQGELAAAASLCGDAHDLADRTAHPLSLALAYWGQAYLHMLDGDPDETAAWAQREIDLCREYLLPLLLSQGLFQLGWARAQAGESAAGIAAMEDAIQRVRASGSEMGLPFLEALLGEACGRAGEIDRGLSLIDQALEAAGRTGAHFGRSTMLRLKGTLVLARDRTATAQAESCYRAALDAGATQGAPLPRLRAAIALARLWIDSGRRTDAAALLRPLVDAFPSADTADLEFARALAKG